MSTSYLGGDTDAPPTGSSGRSRLSEGSEPDLQGPSPPALAGGEPTPWEHALSVEATGDLQEAARAYLACPPDPVRGRSPAVFQAAWCLERAGRVDGAAGRYAEVIGESTEPALLVEAHFRLAWLALERHQMEVAVPHFGLVVDLAEAHGLTGPTVEHARYWSAVCLEGEGRLVEAALHYQPIIERGNLDLWPEAAYRRMLCLSQVGDFEGAFAAAEVLLQPAVAARDRDRLQALQALAREEQRQIERARALA